ncbi:zinc-ribbon domain-containing protein [Aedoeadaptatus coli]|uniref:zinc-ribbon domain-containing protein n=1 Tax=Aedoeadaptatus coli TaxID=2058292 RepID=UPI00131F2C20
MKCLSCGADNAADAKFCKSCGQPLENNAPRDTAILEPVAPTMRIPPMPTTRSRRKSPGKRRA